jgi:hypothetical protein
LTPASNERGLLLVPFDELVRPHPCKTPLVTAARTFLLWPRTGHFYMVATNLTQKVAEFCGD